ncbi:MAG: hypothetical protein ACK5AQ_03805, partial [Bacteroidota bacterium]
KVCRAAGFPAMFTVFKMTSSFGRSADAASVRGALSAQTFLLCKKVTASIANASCGCAFSFAG